MDLKQAKVLITGGSSGIGYETAKLLVSKNASVIISARNEKNLKAAAKESGCIPLVADVSNEEEVVTMVQKTIRQLEGFNVLINNAAFGYFELLVNTDATRMRELFETNVIGAMLVARESAKYFI